MYLPIPEKSIILVKYLSISSFAMPRIEPFKYIFSFPVSSGWKPVPTSNNEAILPLMYTSPVVGEEILEIIFWEGLGIWGHV